MMTAVPTTNGSAAWAAFPVHSIADGKCTCGRADCHSPGKHPKTKNGLLDATSDPEILAQWWREWPDANLAVATGEINNVVVVDVDPDKGGSDSLHAIEEQYQHLPETVEVETGGGGLHLYYRYPTGLKIGSRNGWRPGVDIKAEGGYVVAPPSLHKSGRRYRYAEGRAPGQIEMAEIPAWLLDLLPRKDEPPQAVPPHHVNGSANGHAGLIQRAQAYVAKAQAASEGTRNDMAFRLAGHVAALSDAGMRLGEGEIVSLLGPWNLRNDPPLPDHELRQCVASAMTNGAPRPAKEPARGMPDLRPAEYRDEPRIVTYQRITSAELATGDYSIEFAIEGAMVLGQPLTIGGPMKVLKTSILIDGAVSLASGGYFLGRLKVNKPRRVLVMSGESGLATIQETALRISTAAGVQLKDLGNLIWSPDLPKFGSADHLDALGKFLRDDGIEVLFCDPAYLAMPSTDAGNLMAQGELLRNVADICRGFGVSFVLCHHTKRNTGQDAYEPLELQHLAWAGHAEFARQWWLVNRRERYEPGTGEHRLWLSIGGSAGHSSLWAMDVSEGRLTDPGGRRWEIELTDAAGARDAAKERQKESRQQVAAERLESDRKAVCEALAGMPERTGTKRTIRDAAALNTARFDPAFASLIRDKSIAPVTIIKGNNRTYDAYKLSPELD